MGKENVVLWGLSQGCATSLSSLLTWDGEPFAAVVGMCGWLPFANEIMDVCMKEAPDIPGLDSTQEVEESEDEDEDESESSGDRKDNNGEEEELSQLDHLVDPFSRLNTLSEDPFSSDSTSACGNQADNSSLFGETNEVGLEPSALAVQNFRASIDRDEQHGMGFSENTGISWPWSGG